MATFFSYNLYQQLQVEFTEKKNKLVISIKISHEFHL